MSDVFGNHIVGFPTRRLIFLVFNQVLYHGEHKKVLCTIIGMSGLICTRCKHSLISFWREAHLPCSFALNKGLQLCQGL